ncbi:MAG TPA: hypothetical protein VGJ06_15015 [Candidatus Acidoferrum sp.]
MDRVRNNHDASATGKGTGAKPKRPYVKPAFQHEKVFETMALACGKLGPTQAQCRFNRRNS